MKERLTDLRILTEHYARLFALTVVDESDYRKKFQSAARLVDIFQAAASMKTWAARQFHTASLPVAWNAELDPVRLHVLGDGRLDRAALDALLRRVWAAMIATQAEMLDFCSGSREFLHWTPVVNKLIAGCPESPAISSDIPVCPAGLARSSRSPRAAMKRIVGPRTSRLDPTFSAEYSLQEFAAPIRADSIESMVPYFWTLATREAMVCDSCLLSAIEYDGLPLQFYRDMARQAADEARHSVMYLDLSFELMPPYLAVAQASDKVAILIRKFLDGAASLPIAKEGNLFSCMWHADLEERLVIMQLTTEGPAVASTRAAIDSSLARQFPSVRRAFEVDYYDEVAHTRIGTRWLRYLCPNAAQRRDMIERAKLLRGVLLLTCFISDDEPGNIAALMNRYGSNPKAGMRDFFA